MIDKLAWLYIQNRKLLITRSKGKSVWYIPGGKRERTESDIDALKREVVEELSVELTNDSIQHIGTFEGQADGHPTGVIVKMTCYTGEFTGNLRPSAEIEEMDWFSYQDRVRTSITDQKIFEFLKERGLID